MRPKKKSYRRKVAALVEATPTYLSVVDRGASGSPFTVVKREDSPMKIKPRAGAAPKSAVTKSNKAVDTPAKRKKAEQVTPQTETVITKFVLAKAQYETLDAAKAFMEESDFEGEMTFEETDDSIIVYNADVQDRTIVKESDIETGEEGVMATVAHVTIEDGDDPETVQNSEDEDDTETVENADDMDDEDEEDEDDKATATGKGKKKPTMSEKADDEDSEDEESEDEESVENACGNKKKPRKYSEEGGDEEPAVLSKREQFLADLQKEAEPKEVVRKFDMYEVWVENDNTDFASLMKAGMKDGAAPGLNDVLWTFGESVRKSLRKGESVAEQLRKDAMSMVDLVVAQNELFNNILESSPEDVAKAESSHSYEDLQKWAKSFGKSLLEEGERATETVAKSDTSASNNRVTSTVDVASVVDEKIAPVLETMQNLAKTVDKIASRKQVSKSVPTSDLSADEEADPQKKEKSTKQEAATKNLSAVVFGR